MGRVSNRADAAPHLSPRFSSLYYRYTSYINDASDPVWEGERLQLKLTAGGERPIRLRVEIWDKDLRSADRLLARGEVVFADGPRAGEHTLRLTSDDPDKYVT